MAEVDTIKPKRGRRTKKVIEPVQELAQEQVQEPAQEQEQEQELVQELTHVQEPVQELVQEPTQELEQETIMKPDITLHIEETTIFETQNSIMNENIIIHKEDDLANSKKRGRKPKGGKIIQQNIGVNGEKEAKPNIILHLKCSINDIHQGLNEYENIKSYHFTGSKNDLAFEVLDNDNNVEESNCGKVYMFKSQPDKKQRANSEDETMYCVENKEIRRKLKILEQNLHVNNISDKKSACFWCSYDFDNPPIYIPKYFIKNSYNVYGCFCTPECAVAYLMEENIDSSTKFERYHLINHIYSKIYDYKKNIKPAPNPHYMLEKFYGNLSIQEYRSLLKSERLFLIVDKPLTRVLPEFHEDNDDFIINSKIIPSNSNYKIKKKIQKTQNKSDILNENFGIHPLL